MRLSAVRIGDIVRAGHLHAVVIGKENRKLVVQGVCNGSVRRLSGGEVEAHWRQVKARAAKAKA
jgi:hypothetical protein